MAEVCNVVVVLAAFHAAYAYAYGLGTLSLGTLIITYRDTHHPISNGPATRGRKVDGDRSLGGTRGPELCICTSFLNG